MAKHEPIVAADAAIPITGRRLSLPEGPIFKLQPASRSDYVVGVFRAWAGYKNCGSDEVTDGLAHFQHVLSFATAAETGRTGVHGHFAHAHIILPTSGRGVFSYDGVITEATPGSIIVQHAGTIHDQFDYSYAAADEAENRLTPLSLEPASAGAPPRSFGFLELFVPLRFANVEIVPPAAVTEDDQRTAWDHPYHAESERFSIQRAEDASAAFQPIAGRDDLEVRDGATWEATGGLAAVWVIRAAEGAEGLPAEASIAGESGGIDIWLMIEGSARLPLAAGGEVELRAGDCLTCSQDAAGLPVGPSAGMRLLKLFVAGRAQALRERTPEEIRALEALGPAIITSRALRGEGDALPINGLREAREGGAG